MKATNTIALSFVFVLGVLMISSSAQAGTDILRWTKAGDYVLELDKNVITEDYSTITYQGLGKQARNDIIFVYYNDDVFYKPAETAYDNGEWKAAIEGYKGSMERSRKEWVQWYARYRMGQCYWYIGDQKSAEEILLDLNNKYPKNPFFPQVNILLSEIYTYQKKFDAANKLLKDIITRRNEFMVCWVEKAEVMTGEIFIAQKDTRNAESHFKRIQPRLTYIELKNDAELGLGRCLEVKGETEKDPKAYRDAIKVYEGIIASYNPVSMPRCYAAIARCYYMIKEYESAFATGLRGGLLFIETQKPISAESLYYAGKALVALYHAEKDETKKAAHATNIVLIRRLFEGRILFGQPYAVKGLDELK